MSFTPQITVTSPYPRQDLPALFVWTERIRHSVADDTQPADLDQWMDWSLERMRSPDLHTWGIYRDGQIGGYFEALRIERNREDWAILPDESLLRIAQAQCVFKRDLWGLRTTKPALNLCLQSAFAEVVTIFMPVFSHNRPLKELFNAVGASNVGIIAPRLQNGNPIDTQLYALSSAEWAKCNPEFVRVEEAQEVTA